MTRRLAQLAAGLAALTIVLAAVVGIPIALIVYVGWPLPTAWPTVDQARQFLQTGVSDTTIIKLLAVIVWAAWAQLTIALLVETAALVRRRAVQTLRLLPGLQPLAARLVATIALTAAALGPHRELAAPPLDQLVAAAPAVLPDLAPAAAPVASTEAPDQVDPGTIEVTTRERDTWWRIAETHVGDGLRWREIRDLNIGRQVATGVSIQPDTDHLEPGWTLRVPTDGAAPAPSADDEPDRARAGEWHVDPGDHFWAIATHTLEARWGRTPTDPEIAPYWRQLVEANRDRLLPPDDPDLIYPDQQFILPPVSADPAAPPQPAPPTADDGRSASPPESDQPRGVPRGGSSDAAPEEEPSPETPADGWEAALGGDGQQPAEPPEVSQGVEDEPQTAFGIPAGLTGGAAASSLLAAGVVATIRWRRRRALQQRPTSYRLPTPLPESTDQLNRLAAATPPDQVLDDLATLLGTISPDTHPVLVTTTDDGTVTLLFDDDTDIPDPPAPWELTDDPDGPVGWTAHLDDPGPDRSIGLPLLVTLGRTNGTNVLANITAMPTLTVHGPDEQVRERLRTMALEVATSRVAVPLDVIIAGDDRLASLEQVRHGDHLAQEVEEAAGEVARDIIPDDRIPRLLVSHSNGQAPDVPAEVIGTVAVITASDTERPNGWTLEVADRRTGQLHLPDGSVVQLELPDIDPQAIDAELDRLDQPPAPPPQHPAEQDEPNPAVDPATNGHQAGQQITVVEPPFCEVRLLGPVEVVRDGERVEGFTRRPLEVLAYLVTHREGTTTGRIDAAIWPNHARPGSQRIGSALTRIRRLIGNGPDGQPLLPPRTGEEPIPLSDHVGCDLDRALEHLTLADRANGHTRARHQQAALDLVRGEPFQDLLADWSTDISQQATVRLQDAAVQLARACREDGDYDRAEHAIRQGHALLDGNGDLYLEHARLEHARGHPERIPDIRDQYRHSLADSADETAGTSTGPAQAVEAAFQDLAASP